IDDAIAYVRPELYVTPKTKPDEEEDALLDRGFALFRREELADFLTMNAGLVFFDTRLQLHWAAQAAAGVGRTLLPRRDDFSHESFEWLPDRRVLAQGEHDGWRAAIRPRDLTLIAGDDELPLDGRTLDEAFAFFEKRCGVALA